MKFAKINKLTTDIILQELVRSSLMPGGMDSIVPPLLPPQLQPQTCTYTKNERVIRHTPSPIQRHPFPIKIKTPYYQSLNLLATSRQMWKELLLHKIVKSQLLSKLGLFIKGVISLANPSEPGLLSRCVIVIGETNRLYLLSHPFMYLNIIYKIINSDEVLTTVMVT